MLLFELFDLNTLHITRILLMANKKGHFYVLLDMEKTLDITNTNILISNIN